MINFFFLRKLLWKVEEYIVTFLFLCFPITFFLFFALLTSCCALINIYIFDDPRTFWEILIYYKFGFKDIGLFAKIK